MLRFEFSQNTEFSDPEYIIYDYDGEYIGFIYFNTTWNFISSSSWGLSSGYLDIIADKLDEINESTQSQRILGVF